MNPRNLKRNEPIYDDCPVCQAMKKMGVRPQAVDPEGKILITPLHPKQMEVLLSAMQEAEDQGKGTFIDLTP
jgi:hypothetical protein